MFEAVPVVPAAMAVGDFARCPQRVRARQLGKVVLQVCWRLKGLSNEEQLRETEDLGDRKERAKPQIRCRAKPP